MRVAVADDEPLARSLLTTLLKDAQVEVVGEACDGAEAVVLVDRLAPDTLFLDIDMPGGGGILAAHSLLGRSDTLIVFVTAHESHAIDAFELGAVDYLLKPVRRPRLAKALDRVRGRLAERLLGTESATGIDEGHIWVRTAQGMLQLAIPEIIWIEAARDYVYLHTAKASYLHRARMTDLEKALQDTGLARVRRSAFARLSRVTGIVRRGKAVFLELGALCRVGVGSTYEDQILARLDAASAKRRR